LFRTIQNHDSLSSHFSNPIRFIATETKKFHSLCERLLLQQSHLKYDSPTNTHLVGSWHCIIHTFRRDNSNQRRYIYIEEMSESSNTSITTSWWNLSMLKMSFAVSHKYPTRQIIKYSLFYFHHDPTPDWSQTKYLEHQLFMNLSLLQPTQVSLSHRESIQELFLSQHHGRLVVTDMNAAHLPLQRSGNLTDIPVDSRQWMGESGLQMWMSRWEAEAGPILWIRERMKKTGGVLGAGWGRGQLLKFLGGNEVDKR